MDRRSKWRIDSVDQVVEVAGYSSSKGVHHKVHSFLHHLHLCNHVRWSCIYDKSLKFSPQMAPTDYAEKSIVSHTVLTCLKQYLHNTKTEDLVESTSMVSAKYPPKVKLEIFTTLE